MENNETNFCYEVNETAEEYKSREKDEISFEIVDHLGVLRTGGNGWNREINVVSWNGRKANFDLRDWTPDHNRMTKGITLTREEMRTLCKLFTENDSKKEEAAQSNAEADKTPNADADKTPF